MNQDPREKLTNEQLLQHKIEEYRRAEALGKQHAELLQLYKEIKELQLQVITSSSNYQYWAKADRPTDYRR